MNERIRELELEAIAYADSKVPVDSRYNDIYHSIVRGKFAELIVRECADITIGLSKLFPRTDVAFDVGYTTGTKRATKEIKQHFGVE
jgi:hypothetical protein